MNSKTFIFCAAFCAFSLPAWANNAPRPDGALYLILLFPFLAAAAHFAGVPKVERSGWARALTTLGFVLLILMAAAGTELGFLAVLVLFIHGLLRSIRIAVRGSGWKRFAGAALALLATFAAVSGYVWASFAGSRSLMERARQKRTMADMRTISTGLMSWSSEHRASSDALAAGAAGTTTDAAAPSAPGDSQILVSFAAHEAPPLIEPAELESLLVPDHLAAIPGVDGWNRPFEIRFDPDTHQFQIRSAGANGEFELEAYEQGSFLSGNWDCDIVSADGFFISWPEGTDPGQR